MVSRTKTGTIRIAGVDRRELAPLSFDNLWPITATTDNPNAGVPQTLEAQDQRFMRWIPNTGNERQLSRSGGLTADQQELAQKRWMLDRSVGRLRGYFFRPLDEAAHRVAVDRVGHTICGVDEADPFYAAAIARRESLQADFKDRCERQAAFLNELLDEEQNDGWVRIHPYRGEHASLAKLRGYFVDESERGEYLPGLVLEGVDETIGLRPLGSYVAGLYFSLEDGS